MKSATDFSHPIDDLLSKVLDGTLDGRDQYMLADLLRDDPNARRLYHDHIALHALFHWRESGKLTDGGEDGGLDIDFSSPEVFQAAPLFTPVASNATWYGMAGNFANHTYALSYLIAAFVLGVAMLASSVIYVSNPKQMVDVEPNTEPTRQEQYVFVGRITGMKDCRWSDPQTGAYVGSSVPLDRRYALASGLLEISYNSGAKVTLEGPCEYTADSDAGGYLAVGRLTARITGRGRSEERRGLAASAAGAKHHAATLKSRIPNPESPAPGPQSLAPTFSVTTPTAVVTDLGTEFGVDVSKDGNTTSHVFRGSVRVQVIEDGRPRGVLLKANESARVEKGKGEKLRLLVGDDVGNPPKFARRLIELPKRLDLLDIVAGGNGAGARREAGINPSNGVRDFTFTNEYRRSDCRYWPVVWSPFIDGVFVPDGRIGTSRISSAGHVFADFPETKGASFGSIWARAAECKVKNPAKNTESWVYCIGNPKQFMPQGLGLLALHPNASITFDLKAIRRTFSINKPMRFRAVAGIADARFRRPVSEAMVSLWILVDGRLELKKENLKVDDAPVNMDVELGPNDQFLTLVATDGGNGMIDDWVLFGDPTLDMTPPEAAETPDGGDGKAIGRKDL